MVKQYWLLHVDIDYPDGHKKSGYLGEKGRPFAESDIHYAKQFKSETNAQNRVDELNSYDNGVTARLVPVTIEILEYS